MLSAEYLLHELADLHRETRELLVEARQSGDMRTALAAIREARSTVEVFAHLGSMADIEERLQALEEGGEHNGKTRQH